MRKKLLFKTFSVLLTLGLVLNQFIYVNAEEEIADNEDKIVNTQENSLEPNQTIEIEENDISIGEVEENEEENRIDSTTEPEENETDDVVEDSLNVSVPSEEEDKTPKNYLYSDDEIEVKIKAAYNAFPKNAKLEVEKLEEGTSNYEAAKSYFDENKVIVAYDVRFIAEVDGAIEEVEPSSPIEVELKLNKSTYPIKIDENSIEIQHLKEVNNSIQVELVASKDEVNTLNPKNTTSKFTLESLSVLAFLMDKEETYVLDDAIENQETHTEDIYYYALVPGIKVDDADKGTHNPNNWYYLGKGTISADNLTAPTNSGKKDLLDTLENLSITKPTAGYSSVWAKPSENSNTYKEYKYAEIGSENATKEGYYTLQPMRIVDTAGGSGLVDGSTNNAPHTETQNSSYNYHFDYYIQLNRTDLYQVAFSVKEPNSNEFTVIDAGAATVAKNTEESTLTQPSNKDVPQTKVVDGITYEFDGWYRDENCTNKCNFNEKVTSNRIFYGKYVPKTTTLKISNTVKGKGASNQEPFTYLVQLTDIEGNHYKLPLKDTVDERTHNYSEDQQCYVVQNKHGESMDVLIPTNMNVKVTQIQKKGYTTSHTLNNENHQYKEDEFTHEQKDVNDDHIAFVNEINQVPITISKDVTGNFADTSKEFEFDVQILINGDSPYLGLEDENKRFTPSTNSNLASHGHYTFKLSDFLNEDGSIVVNLPVGAELKFSETDYSGEGYSTSWASNKIGSFSNQEFVPGISHSVLIPDDATNYYIRCKNDKSGTVPTGTNDQNNTLVYLVISTLGLGLATLYVIGLKRRRHI